MRSIENAHTYSALAAATAAVRTLGWRRPPRVTSFVPSDYTPVLSSCGFVDDDDDDDLFRMFGPLRAWYRMTSSPVHTPTVSRCVVTHEYSLHKQSVAVARIPSSSSAAAAKTASELSRYYPTDGCRSPNSPCTAATDETASKMSVST